MLLVYWNVVKCCDWLNLNLINVARGLALLILLLCSEDFVQSANGSIREIYPHDG